jgi:FkbM family methyltransferase
MTSLVSRLFGNVVLAYHKSGARGAARLFAILARAVNAEPLLLTTTRDSIKVALTPRHYIDTEIIRHGYYEKEVLDAILKYLKPNDVFWDVGANIGLHSVTVKSLRPDATVVAFEPNPEIVIRLQKNMRLNGTYLQLVQAALWDVATLRGLCLNQPFNPGMATLVPNPEQSSLITYVSCYRGDDLIKDGLVPTPNVIKMDVEGAESNVLDGLAETLRSKGVRAVIFEHTPGETNEAGAPITRLPTFGFRIEQLKSQAWARHSNYVAVRD